MNEPSAGQVSERIKELSEAIHGATDEVELTQLYIERGHCYQSAGDEVNSVRDYFTAIETAAIASDRCHPKAMIALALAKKDQKEQAIYWAVNALNDDSSNAEAHHVMGVVCNFFGFVNQALESIQKAIDLQPDRWQSIRMLGVCLRENRRLQESVETLSRYVEHNPDDPKGLYDLAWSYQLLAAFDATKTPLVRDLYNRALQCGPDSNLQAKIERKLAKEN